MLYEAIIVSLIVIATVGGAELLGMTMLNRPIVIGPLVGLALGDIQSGVLIGASLEAVFMGVVNIGGASAAEPGLATAVGTAFAITLGGGAGVALPLAIPIGILGLQVKTLLYVGVIGFFAPVFDRLAAEGKERKIVLLHYGAWVLQWGLYGLLPFIGILAGSDAINAFVKAIPQVIMNGLNICGGLLPAVGMAMLLKLLWDKKIYAFFFLGFILVAYLKLPLVALAVLGAIIAVTIAQRDYQLSQLTKKMNAAPATAAPAGNAGQMDTEEEDFFDE
ncbi:MAG: PTS sugar transporter subunit IIC [Sporolactobacillus sp.]|uniref:PTS mannose/fructose/sorbose/N-acetylgalactosamine transporter subunit IIC n=1 Tax=Sporolactobacillus sp. STSJ-5 TaxID=2965076 RepID=UPI0021037ED4|nr:PTS sugar transporter subunit IIC [Sporolactobacillus sp. STSJ-5]MCQ2011438.1 PTS sugar transporter subunit IIC [Sporolactobacillus sp. STSJ-5]